MTGSDAQGDFVGVKAGTRRFGENETGVNEVARTETVSHAIDSGKHPSFKISSTMSGF